jgi:hypothetical protein
VGGELHFAYLTRRFPSDPRLFFPENEKTSTPLPCGFLMGIYPFYENWSTETFRKSQRSGLFTTIGNKVTKKA